MGYPYGVDSEVGRLRTVLAHRPGAGLLRITPRTREALRSPASPGWPGPGHRAGEAVAAGETIAAAAGQ